MKDISLMRCLVMHAVCLLFYMDGKTLKDQQMTSELICRIILKVI